MMEATPPNSVIRNKFNNMTQERSECCGANLHQYEDNWGICGDCKEWAQSESETD
jgi:hypothetical protein